MSKLKHDFDIAVNSYAAKFMAKHNLDTWEWLRDEPGRIAVFGDYFIDFFNMKFDIDNTCQKDLFFKWYDENMSKAMAEEHTMNYDVWCKQLLTK